MDWNCVRNRGGVEGIICPGKNGLDRDWGGGVDGRSEPEATGKTFWNLVACSDSRDWGGVGNGAKGGFCAGALQTERSSVSLEIYNTISGFNLPL
jgi:hypothetical protein